jgi:hypothetical protein
LVLFDLETARKAVLIEARYLVRKSAHREERGITIRTYTDIQRAFAQNARPILGGLSDLVSPGDVKFNVLSDSVLDHAMKN